MRTYPQDRQAAISFPLGGIGAGSVGLAGNGALVDWEINNRPNRESINPFTGFAIKAEDSSRVLDWRFVQGDTMRDFMGGMHALNHSWGYGHGPNRSTLAGGRHFEHTEFQSEFPFARIVFGDARFPGRVELSAFNPFIPSNDRDSSIPAAMFELSVTNTSTAPLRYTLALSLTNPLESFSGPNVEHREPGLSALTLHSGVTDAGLCGYGDVTMATDAPDAQVQRYWYRGGWFDELTMFMNEFGARGPLKPRDYQTPAQSKPDTGTLAVALDAAPGQTCRARFVLSWFVPNYRKYWGERAAEGDAPDWRNYYAKLFDSSRAAAQYCLENWARLYGDSLSFARALGGSTLPDCVLDAIEGNLATLKSSTCLRLTDGDFYGWEGVNRTTGSCEGTCQHVWNYAYALPLLFPRLERGVRSNEIKYSLDECGRMRFRMMLPLGAQRWGFRACVDGQMGTVMKCYREWKLSGDTQWLRANWDAIRSMIEFAWSPDNEDKWDEGATGVMRGRQHHTLDVELFGAHSWLTGFYHGALLAGAEMARALGDEPLAERYEAIYRRGHEWLEANTFNGEHYVQAIDIGSDELLRRYGDDPSINMENGYWDAETRQVKYQIGDGCEIDQVVADWHAGLMGLKPIFDPAHRAQALRSIYRLNMKCMRDLNNPCRVFACNGERGVTMCAWAEPERKPAIPVPYSEEVMTGFEYAFAGSLLQCGMEREALDVVSAIRARYDGRLRNPFSEIECGASYARAMASYALLLIYSGFRFDMTRGMLGFRPVRPGRYFWSADGAWGTVELNGHSLRLNVIYGGMALRQLEHPLPGVRAVSLNGRPIDFAADAGCAQFDVALSAGDALELWAE